MGTVDLLIVVSVAAVAAGGVLGWAGHLLWARRSSHRAARTSPAPTGTTPLLVATAPEASASTAATTADAPPSAAPADSSAAPRVAWSPPEVKALIPVGEPSSGIGLAARVILHLASLGRLGPDDLAKLGSTQQGIAAALGVSQGSLVRVLQRLVAGEMVTVERRHVATVNRRLKVYCLTGRGESAARDLRHRRLDTLRAQPGSDWTGGGFPHDRSGRERDRLSA